MEVNIYECNQQPHKWMQIPPMKKELWHIIPKTQFQEKLQLELLVLQNQRNLNKG